MNSETVTIVIKGVKFYFNGDALTSPTQEAISFLIKIADKEVVF